MPEQESGGQRYGLGAVHFPPSLLSMRSLSVTQSFFLNLFVLATTTSQSLRCLRPSQELGAFSAHTNLSKVNESHGVNCNTFVVFIFFYFSTLLITFQIVNF